MLGSSSSYDYAQLKAVINSEVFSDQYHRKKEGLILPEISSSQLKRIYGKYEEYGELSLSACRTYFVTKTGPVMNSRILREFPGYGTPMERLFSYFSFPNGQVKNFLNACRACVSLEGEVYVCVLGSKSSEGSGLWHKYFALYLAQRCSALWIDFYDFNERAQEWNFSIGNASIHCRWIPRPQSLVELVSLKYDCVVDDVWSYDTGPGLITDFHFENYF
jgi:hypothetical protein